MVGPYDRVMVECPPDICGEDTPGPYPEGGERTSGPKPRTEEVEVVRRTRQPAKARV